MRQNWAKLIRFYTRNTLLIDTTIMCVYMLQYRVKYQSYV